MYNLYDNTFSKEDKKKYNSILVDQINECQPSFILAINNFFKILNESPELLYKIIKFVAESDLSDSFLLFITNNLCVDILSPEIIPAKFLLIIENILYDEISKISNINNLITILSNLKISKLFIGFKFYNEVSNYFNLIIGEVIENYENSGINSIPLIFNVSKLAEYLKLKEEIINNDLNSEKEFKREEAKKKKKNEINTISNIYKMKFQGDDSSSSSLSGLFSFEEEDFNIELNNSETFMKNYAPEMDRKELNEIIKKYSEDEFIQDYLKKQIILLDKNEKLFSNCVFFDNVGDAKESEKILYYYQRNFNIVRDIISKVNEKFVSAVNLIPYSIKCLCRIIYNLIILKFPTLTKIEINKYINIFFFNIIIEQLLISSDYGSLVTTTIISNKTKYNIKVIFDIWKKFINGKFYTNDNKDQCDYTPFNWYFIDIMHENIDLCEKLIDVSIPEYLLRKNIHDNNSGIAEFKKYETKKNFYSYSSCFTIDNLSSIINIINCNRSDFFQNKEKNPLIDEFKKSFITINENGNVLKNLREKDNANVTNFYIFNEILYSGEISNIIHENKKEEKLFSELIKNEKIDNKDLNELIKMKNYIYNLLHNIDLINFKNNSLNVNFNNLKDILTRLDKYYQMKLFLSENYKNTTNEIKSKMPNNDFNKFSEYNINSLLSFLETNKIYSKNNYKILFDLLLKDVSNSIERYDFELLSPIYKSLNNIKENISLYIINEVKYRNIFISCRLRRFIENEQIEVEIKFKYNTNEKYFIISKVDQNSNKYYIRKEKTVPVICHNIPDFIKKFPNLSKIHIKDNEINVRKALSDYFNILKKCMTSKFSVNEFKSAYSQLKKRIIIKLYNKLFPKDPDTDDLTFHYQCLYLSWIKPKHLNQSEIINENFIKIITELFNQMNNEKSYSGKLEIIEQIFRVINYILKINKGDNFSTDDIAPLCEYALIKSKPERLSSNLRFIQMLMPEKSSSLSKMHFDYLKIHMNIIKNCNYNHFNDITEKEFIENCQKEKEKLIDINI